MTNPKPVKEIFWGGPVPRHDDYGNPISLEFIDGRTRQGRWAMMSPESWRLFGCGSLGSGSGQQYRMVAGGRWKKVAG